MQNNKLLLKFSAIVLLVLGLVTSCTKDNKSPDYSYYISKEFSFSCTKTNINSLISFVSGSIPEAGTLKPLVISDVNV